MEFFKINWRNILWKKERFHSDGYFYNLLIYIRSRMRRKYILWEKLCGTSVAQMIEHSTGNRKVLGSIPSGVEAFLFSQKISSFQKDFDLVLKVSLHRKLLTNQDILRIFSWILPRGQTWYKTIVKFQMRTVLYTLYKQIRNIDIFINIPKFF